MLIVSSVGKSPQAQGTLGAQVPNHCEPEHYMANESGRIGRDLIPLSDQRWIVSIRRLAGVARGGPRLDARPWV